MEGGAYMDIVLSRILKYLNGCLDDDHMYRIGLFIVHHYVRLFIAKGHGGRAF